MSAEESRINHVFLVNGKAVEIGDEYGETTGETRFDDEGEYIYLNIGDLNKSLPKSLRCVVTRDSRDNLLIIFTVFLPLLFCPRSMSSCRERRRMRGDRAIISS